LTGSLVREQNIIKTQRKIRFLRCVCAESVTPKPAVQLGAPSGKADVTPASSSSSKAAVVVTPMKRTDCRIIIIIIIIIILVLQVPL
jgi:hypothetical protein